jgi:hypothetical protein
MMNAPSSWRLSRYGEWLRTHPFTSLGGVLLVVMAIIFCRRHESEWEQVYLPAAAHLWRGEPLYRLQDAYLYPPFMAWATLPFLALPTPLPRLLWFTINAVCSIALVRWSWRLAGGGRLEGCHEVKTSERWAAFLGCLCGISYMQNCLAHQQTDIVIATILVGGCLSLLRCRAIVAATLLGVAAACKCTGLLFAPYLLWRGRPFAALGLLVVALGVNLLPDLVSTAPTGRSWLREYALCFLQPLTAADHYIGTWGSDPVYNQSLTGMGQRWCTTMWTWTPTDCTLAPRLPLLTPRTLRLVMYAVDLTLLTGVLFVCGRPFRKLRDDANNSRQALECGIVLLLMLLLSPMSSKAHFGTLIIPGCCLARAAIASRSLILKLLLAGTVLLGLLSNKDPLGERLYTLSLWYGVVTWQSLLLLAGCMLAYRQTRITERAALPCPAPPTNTTSAAA